MPSERLAPLRAPGSATCGRPLALRSRTGPIACAAGLPGAGPPPLTLGRRRRGTARLAGAGIIAVQTELSSARGRSLIAFSQDGAGPLVHLVGHNTARLGNRWPPQAFCSHSSSGPVPRAGWLTWCQHPQGLAPILLWTIAAAWSLSATKARGRRAAPHADDPARRRPPGHAAGRAAVLTAVGKTVSRNAV